jgi:hypothetical protein
MHQQLDVASGDPALFDGRRPETSATMSHRRQCPWRTGWLAGEPLEDADMKDNVESCAHRQLQPVGDTAHPL